jgi:hypothetical protein
MRWYTREHRAMSTPRARRFGTTGALLALSALLVGVIAAPSPAAAQPVAPAAQRVVVLLPFEGTATADLVADAESTVRGALLARGARLPDRAAINLGLGLTPPTDTAALARAAQSMGATLVLRATVRPFAGQYNLSLTLVDAASARTATREESIPHEGGGEVVGRMLDALLDPASWSAPPVDPAIAREAEARRLAAEEAERQRVAAAAAAAAGAQQRAADEARRQREADERAHPVRGYADGGPVAVGLSLVAGGRLSGVRQPTGTVLSGNAPTDASGAAVALRAEGAYALGAVRGLELAAALMILTTPTTAVGVGAGAQYTFPSSGRLPLRGTAGVLLGVWQGASGARATTLWLNPFVRAEWGFTPTVQAFVGLSLDVAPADNGGVTSLGVMAGVRFRLGASAPAAR